MKVRMKKMNVTVKSVKHLKGTNAANERYCFTSALVIKEDGYHADYVNIDESVCNPNKIKPGVIADMYVSSKNEKQVVIFDIKRDAPASDEAASVTVDVSTGEVIDDIPLPEPPADVLAAHERDKAKQKNTKS